MSATEIITRRRLPHWYVPGAMHFLTYRLAGTIPLNVVQELRERKDGLLKGKPPPGLSGGQFRERIHKQIFAAYDDYLDHTSPLDWLAKPTIAAMLRGNLYHHHGGKYHLLAYCIMPNHVHVLLQPVGIATPPACPTEPNTEWIEDGKSPLAEIMHSLKSYTANEANKILRRKGTFWQKESYDHWVRDDDELERIVKYIAWNPVKAKLVQEPQDWYFSSAHHRFLQDGSTVGYLLDSCLS